MLMLDGLLFASNSSTPNLLLKTFLYLFDLPHLPLAFGAHRFKARLVSRLHLLARVLSALQRLRKRVKASKGSSTGGCVSGVCVCVSVRVDMCVHMSLLHVCECMCVDVSVCGRVREESVNARA